ncbi:dephospho-CoA kinase [Bacillus massilinigeriensis]|uniref:dephospho-CoA kinase n=1 Tax=Bacillus mediterraneensis TaxID=1805474 RepID=UPI0008F8831C|nr:dephospho-CoA kinase [Bacillus mediterraneensis]
MGVIIGLTGGIASGKSTVSRLLEKRGFPIIDADIEARNAVEKGEPAYEKIVKEFGEGILHPDGNIDRAKLGSIVFYDEAKRKLLNGFVHPDVRRRMAEKRDEAIQSNAKAVVLDIPLLFESGLENMVDKILVVYVDEETQLRRLMARNNYSKEEALARIHSQMPLRDKVKLADSVIDNSRTVEETNVQLEQSLAKWRI